MTGTADRSELLGIDLNLLVSLRVLLQERSVSRAAQRLGIGQPAMSTQLGRLRRHFADELLTRAGNTYMLTPLATQLLGRVEEAVTGVRLAFSAEPSFDAAVSRRDFRLAMSDHSLAVLGSALCALVEERAPRVRLRIEPTHEGFLGTPKQIHSSVDAVVLPQGYVDELPHLHLYTDDPVLLVGSDNHAVGARTSLRELAEQPWVVTYDWPSSPAIHQLRSQGMEPRVRAVVESFTALPYLIAGTGNVAVMYRRLADRLPLAPGVRVLPWPCRAEPVLETVWWHPMHDTDPGHQWLRSMFVDAASIVEATPRPSDEPHQHRQ